MAVKVQILLLAFLVPFVVSNPNCQRNPETGNCYLKATDDTKKYAEASQICWDLGGYLPKTKYRTDIRFIEWNIRSDAWVAIIKTSGTGTCSTRLFVRVHFSNLNTYIFTKKCAPVLAWSVLEYRTFLGRHQWSQDSNNCRRHFSLRSNCSLLAG